ncbi:MAG: DUF547 domain-containing protein [Flavobacteriales bacterium]|nr:DUF547 domain-containing protein [Flavobacteriales bacterium]
MKICILILNLCLALSLSAQTGLDLSCQLLENVRDQKPVQEQISKLAQLDKKKLAKELDTDNKKKAFWINVYNAFVQIYLNESPDLFEDRGAFFGKERTTIAGKELSFDDIEHGIIRGSKVKLSLGLMGKLFVNEYEKKFRVDSTDGRVHFILNCGAKSCPYIAVLYPDRVEEQLTKAAKEYLKEKTRIEDNQCYTTTLISWFRGDFGGLDGALDYLKQLNVIPKDYKGNLEFDKYDWTLELGNFKEL